MKVKLGAIAIAVALLGTWCASPAMADSIQLQCSTCTSGSVTQMSNAGTVSFSFVDVANQIITGNAFIAILVPTGGVAPTLTGGTLLQSVSFTGGNLGTLLGQNLTGYNLSNFQSASAQASVFPSGYTVYEYSVGTGVTLGPKSAGITGLTFTAPQGSVVVGFVDPPGTTYQTPLSGSISVPEPSTTGLLALGLVGLIGISILRLRQGARST
jgi:PEP-CTERM motif